MAIEARRDVFQAIADPTRRQIISLISLGGKSVNQISEQFNVSRPAISQQVKILVECGLILIRQEGRERICEAKLGALAEVANWIGQYQQFWNQQLDTLDSFLKNEEEKEINKRKKK